VPDEPDRDGEARKCGDPGEIFHKLMPV
jgi:hypothetical protein